MNFGKYGRKQKIKQINSKSNKVSNLISSILIRLVVFLVVLLGIGGVVAGVGAIKGITENSPELDVLLTEIQPEGFKSFIYDQEGNEIQELYGTDANRVYVEYDQIPDYLGNAYVAIEDERFFDHNGIDLKGILRAIYTTVTRSNYSNPEGASTITQQVVKNNVLSTEVTIERKIQEMDLAIKLEENYEKEEILELYMNTVANGRGTNGVQTASRLYFNKDVWDISIAEAAVLASITNNPVKYDPITNPENNRDRASRILTKLLEQGYISDEEYEIAVNEDVYSNIQAVNNSGLSSSSYSYFVDETINSVVEDLVSQLDYTESQAYNLVYRGGLSIYGTQDLEFQEAMDQVFTNEENYPPELEDFALELKYSLTIYEDEKPINKYYEDVFDNLDMAEAYIEEIKTGLNLTEEDFESKKAFENAVYIPQPQAAMVIMDSNNGYVKAITGGRGEKEGSQTFNRATQALRQPGSTFKVLGAYLPAIDAKDYSLASVIGDVPVELSIGSGQTYSPNNWYRNFKGLSSIREGIVYSMNILAVKTVYDIGIDLAFDYLLDLGFTSLHEEKVVGDQVFTDKTLTLPLGGLTDGVSPLELTGAYGAIANGGDYVEPIFYTKVIDKDGNILLEKEPETRSVMKETTAFLLTDAMKDVVDYGTGTAVSFTESDMPLAGKTGTTSGTKDLWFAGFSPYYTAVVWMGYDNPQEMAYVKSYHKYLWRDVMEDVHKDLPIKDFDVPGGLVQVEICTESGLLAHEDVCEHDERGSTVRLEYFTQETVPKEVCHIHVEVDICETSGLLATEYCPEDTVEKKVMIVRDQPLALDLYSEDILNRIEDYQYEMPYSLIGEYCNVHGPEDLELLEEDLILEENNELTEENNAVSDEVNEEEVDANTSN